MVARAAAWTVAQSGLAATVFSPLFGCLAGVSSLHLHRLALALFDARHRPAAARTATGSARDQSPRVKRREARGRQARNSLSLPGCLGGCEIWGGWMRV